MSKTHGGKDPVSINWFYPDLDAANQTAYLSYRGKTNELSVIQFADGNMELRAHDEVTPGGFVISESGPGVIQGAPIFTGNGAPTSVPAEPQAWYVDSGTAIPSLWFWNAGNWQQMIGAGSNYSTVFFQEFSKTITHTNDPNDGAIIRGPLTSYELGPGTVTIPVSELPILGIPGIKIYFEVIYDIYYAIENLQNASSSPGFVVYVIELGLNSPTQPLSSGATSTQTERLPLDFSGHYVHMRPAIRDSFITTGNDVTFDLILKWLNRSLGNIGSIGDVLHLNRLLGTIHLTAEI